MIIALIFSLLGYFAIGTMLAMYWAKNAQLDGWDPLLYVLKCCFKWPLMIANKKYLEGLK